MSRVKFNYNNQKEEKIFMFVKDGGAVAHVIVRRMTRVISQVTGYDIDTKQDVPLDDSFEMYGGEDGEEENRVPLTIGSFLIIRLGSYSLCQGNQIIFSIRDPKVQEIEELGGTLISL